jgi:hypothetical protein
MKKYKDLLNRTVRYDSNQNQQDNKPQKVVVPKATFDKMRQIASRNKSGNG